MRLRLLAIGVIGCFAADTAFAQALSRSPRIVGFGNEPSTSVASSASERAGVKTEGITLEGPIWRLKTLPGLEPAALAALRRPPSLRLLEGRFTGFGGCNHLTGSYSANGSSLRLELASTMMACAEPAAGIERAFLQALNGPLTHGANGDRLTVTTVSHTVLEFAAEPEPMLTGRTWNVTQFNNGRRAVVSTLAGTTLTMSFQDGTVTGQAGCNTFKATFSTEGDRITIGPAATTRKMCAEPVMAQEREFLTALQAATTWTIDGGMLDMHRADGERALSGNPTK